MSNRVFSWELPRLELVTFTVRSDKKCSDILKELDKIFIDDPLVVYNFGGVEHVLTNVHMHIYLTYKGLVCVTKRRFSEYIANVGFVDIKHVKKDNGIRKYLSKEHGFESYEELRKFLIDSII